jgi:hypothetical protein
MPLVGDIHLCLDNLPRQRSRLLLHEAASPATGHSTLPVRVINYRKADGQFPSPGAGTSHISGAKSDMLLLLPAAAAAALAVHM